MATLKGEITQMNLILSDFHVISPKLKHFEY